ncbi:polysaccharide deacetylase family protein (plasmid) [Arthrobacter sp. YA7-1]|uniref:polysaccharide deacetylase family protein n=1 Tax=Arthrobacter sp. YA7-1 TaxID=2987701 RepID=UPI002226AF14|nr:polysaccharide deacetylase family protein [Arthrobacter sp. YA7-1]UYY83720.1 polysaccharide deacetylase family protein [Arthrobacter sp. YA7-1]
MRFSARTVRTSRRRMPVRTAAGRWVTAGATVLLALSGAGISAALAAPPAQAANPTVVTLTFDDGNADQLNAAQIMNNYGLKGTFFTPSGYIDNPGYLSLSDLQGLAAAGHEIGGHTVTHPDLATLPVDEATRQICNDRVNLTNWGFKVTSFAYPFASETAATEAIVKNCGYNSARGLGDIQTRFGCAGCALAETMPPADAYNTAAADEVDNTWTLADLQNTVTQAEPAGGWIQFTFHHISSTSTDPLTITPALFDQFAAWLKARPATTTVQTVDQVIGGTVKSTVSGPAVPPQPASGNLVTNPGLETLTNGMPQCWYAGGYGTNTAAYSVISPGHTGTNAEQLVMSGYVDGDAKLLPALDLGGCSPSATAGHTYNLGAWYKSTTNTQFTLYYRIGLGSWKYWTSSPWYAPATSYQKATWTTPPLPAGANGISFGLNLFSNGTLTTDDYEMFDAANVTPPPPPAPGTNLVQNPGLETAGAGTEPQCWQTGGYGTNTAAFSTAATAHTGTAAESLTVSGYIDGDAKLIQTLDSGSCAPPAIEGHSYSLRAWYTASTVTQFAVYYRDASGVWVYWTSSPWLGASSSYTQASFTTPALPTGATAISFGLSLFSNGTLTTDDYAMYDTVGAPPL